MGQARCNARVQANTRRERELTLAAVMQPVGIIGYLSGRVSGDNGQVSGDNGQALGGC